MSFHIWHLSVRMMIHTGVIIWIKNMTQRGFDIGSTEVTEHCQVLAFNTIMVTTHSKI